MCRQAGRSAGPARPSVVAEPRELAAAVAAAAAASRGGGCLVEELVEGPEVTVNAVSVDGVFVPLAVTDRLTAEPPAHRRRARARLAEPIGDRQRRRGGARRGGGARRPRTGRRTRRSGSARRAARDGAGSAARRRPRRRARRGGDRRPLNDLALDFALGEPPAGTCSGPQTLHGRGRVRVFLVAPDGVLRAVQGLDEAHAVDGVAGCGSTGARAGGSGRCFAEPTGRARSSPSASSREDALERARRAAQAVRFEVDEDPA